MIRQVKNLSQIPAIEEAWENEQYLKLVGWVYDIKSGLIKELKAIDPLIKTEI